MGQAPTPTHLLQLQPSYGESLKVFDKTNFLLHY